MTRNKRISREAKQLFQLCMVNNLLSEERVDNVVRHIASAGYRSCPAVLASFLRLVKLDRARHTANVESATLLPEDLRAATEANLTRLYGPGLVTAFVHRPSLIGGMRIQVGSDVYDGSVKAGLEALGNTF